MYSIEINLLNDRPEYSQEIVASRGAGSGDSKVPLLLGVAAAGSALGLVLVSFGILSFLNQQQAAKEESLDAQLAQLSPQVKEVEALQAQKKVVEDETAALATIFNQIKPWSAMLQDLSDRVPPTLQITKIEQTGGAAAPAGNQPNNAANADPNAAPPPPANGLKLTGNAISFGDVNDFVLTLRKSPFLEDEKTQLTTSEREQNSNNAGGVELVKHEVETEINAVPASELLQALNTTGASGLVTRINLLKQKGVIQP
ncbi:MAG: PilN domain-containing protein [Cyanobacteria bacterium P01_A01_bin.17]